jgi:hypothetical protein
MGVLIFTAKTLFLVFVYIWIRWTLPRYRYDQLMSLCWKWMFPLALLNVLLTAAGQTWKSPLLTWLMPVVTLAAGVGAAALAQRRDPGLPPDLSPGAQPATR